MRWVMLMDSGNRTCKRVVCPKSAIRIAHEPFALDIVQNERMAITRAVETDCCVLRDACEEYRGL
jgi:hypothetical protein